MSEYLKTHHVVCSCYSSEHILQFTYCDDMDDDEVLWTSVQLRQYRSIWKKLWVAIKYVLGHDSRFGAWDCTSLSVSEARKLQKFLDDAIKNCE